MKIKTISLLAVICVISGCAQPFKIPRYNTLVDNSLALKSLSVSNITVNPFVGGLVDILCNMEPPDKLSYEAYIHKALIDELKIAGLFDTKLPGLTLSGAVEKVKLVPGWTKGELIIELRLHSSNGKSMFVSEAYVVRDPFMCRDVASDFVIAVQNLISKVVNAPEFKSLLI